jgi:hypothetical protein
LKAVAEDLEFSYTELHGLTHRVQRRLTYRKAAKLLSTFPRIARELDIALFPPDVSARRAEYEEAVESAIARLCKAFPEGSQPLSGILEEEVGRFRRAAAMVKPMPARLRLAVLRALERILSFERLMRLPRRRVRLLLRASFALEAKLMRAERLAYGAMYGEAEPLRDYATLSVVNLPRLHPKRGQQASPSLAERFRHVQERKARPTK